MVGWGWVSFLFCGLVLAVFAGCMFVLDAVVASYSLLQWYLCFGVLLVAVGLGIWVCVFVGCFSCLDLMICGGPGFLFGFDLCFRFLRLLIVCDCACFSLWLSVLVFYCVGVALVVSCLIGWCLCLWVLVYVAVYFLFVVGMFNSVVINWFFVGGLFAGFVCFIVALIGCSCLFCGVIMV